MSSLNLSDVLYRDVANVYHAMVPPETLQGRRPANLAIAKELASLPDQSRILDVACGPGYDAIAIANGLPAIIAPDVKKHFIVSASDASTPMVHRARQNFTHFFGEGSSAAQIDIRTNTMDALRKEQDWQRNFDAAIVPNVASELFNGMSYVNYNQHLINSLRGVRSVLKPGGMAFVDVRDWEKTFKNQPDITLRQNQHNNTTFTTRYDWSFGATVNSVHTAQTRIWNNANMKGVPAENHIQFAGKETNSLRDLFYKAGFHVVSETPEIRGLNNEPFNTFVLKRRNIYNLVFINQEHGAESDVYLLPDHLSFKKDENLGFSYFIFDENVGEKIGNISMQGLKTAEAIKQVKNFVRSHGGKQIPHDHPEVADIYEEAKRPIMYHTNFIVTLSNQEFKPH